MISHQRDKVAINLVPVRAGGGLQNAISFLSCVPAHRVFVLFDDSVAPIRDVCEERGILSQGFDSRLRYELGGAVKRCGPSTTCFTLFGPPPYCSEKKWLNIAGVAYSNLFYPEIDFWNYLPMHQKLRRRVIDHIRKTGIRRADAWVFETTILAERAIKIGFPKNRVFHVPMSVSKAVLSPNSSGLQPSLGTNSRKRILYLASAHPNKRQICLPGIAQALLNRGFSNFTFVTTMDSKNPYAKKVEQRSQDLGVSKYIENLGSIPTSDVGRLIKSCDMMCLLSRLESFSNNVVEAWAMGVPLVITDADWARTACGDGVVYTDPLNFASSAAKIEQILTDDLYCDQVLRAGQSRLATYPTPEAKCQLFLDTIESVVELGKCPSSLKQGIRF